MKKHFIFSRFLSTGVDENNFMLFELAQYMTVFYYNMRAVHFRTTGTNFLELHEYSQELYEQAEEFYDDLIETSISFEEPITPMYVTPGGWIPEKWDYNRTKEDSINLIKNSVHRIYDYLESIDKQHYPSFVYSKIDSMLEYFDKQNYKITQMDKEIL